MPDMAISLSLYLSVMVIISRAPIEWRIGEPMSVFFHHIIQYAISLA